MYDDQKNKFYGNDLKYFDMELTNNIVNQDQIVVQKIIRQDKAGTVILKGVKKHKITFIDEIEKGKEVQTVFEVECWKKYNYVSPDTEVADECCTLI